MDIHTLLQQCRGFDRDEYNVRKNWERHNVTPVESEQVFFNTPLIAAEDPNHSQVERRFYALGKTDQNRRLFIAFTVRKRLIRVISSRDMNRKERRHYEKREKEKDTQI